MREGARVLGTAATLGRFTLIRRIGAGGFGVVYEADDSHYRCRVALKMLRPDRARALSGFKREFRALADLSHPNLVKLFELGAEVRAPRATGDEQIWYFTMELVEGGSTFLEYVAGRRTGTRTEAESCDRTKTDGDFTREVVRDGSPSADASRLREATQQLVEAVNALHTAGKLHCDLKPSNVLVTPEDRVVVLDFGLVADIDEAGRPAPAKSDEPRGTPGYMSPEQVRRGERTPKADWYSVGAMLHEALTGRLPAPGARPVVSDPDHSALAELCEDLLHADPTRRPSFPEIMERLGDLAAPSTWRSETARRAFFGRREELARLHEASKESAASDGATLVQVVAPSGMGKTSLAHRFLDEIERADPEAVVLRGRCFEQESVPYKLFDSVMDALVRHLGRCSAEEIARIAPRQASRLSRLFRVFEGVPFPEGRARDDDAERDVVGWQTQRREAFQALRELLGALAAHRQLVVFFDDLHWGDVDSARLLAELVRPPGAPRMLLVATLRPDSSSPVFLAELEAALAGVRTRTITLEELPLEESRSMAAHLLGASLADLADSVAREGAGHPIFIQQLAERALVSGDRPEASAPNLGDVILDRVHHLDAEARKIIEVVATAGQPIAEAVAAEAAGVEGAAAMKASFVARGSKLILSRSDPSASSTTTLELAHDRVREAINASMTPETTRRLHGRLADALVAYGDADPEDLLRHYHGAGDSVQTRRYGAAAAVRAENAYAFDRAARYYTIVLEHTPPGDASRWQLLRSWAEALANAGRGGEAGDAFQLAADALQEREPRHPDIITLSLRAGEHALRSGRLDVGTDRMRHVLHRVGVEMPRSRVVASAQAFARRLRLFARGTRPRPLSVPLDPRRLARLDALWAASTGLSMANHVVADALGVLHLLEALDAGSTSTRVRGLGYEAAFEAVIGGPIFRRRCRRMLHEMDALAATSQAPYDRAWAEMSKGVTSWFAGEWSKTWAHCTAASALYKERCRGVAWELAICDAYRFPSLTYMGELREVAELVPAALRAARERGDLFAASNLRMGQQSIILLADDRPEEAIAEASEAIAAFSTATYLLPHYHHLFARVQAELYRGRVEEAWRCMEADWAGLVESKLLMAQFMRVEIRHLRARTAIALASSSGARRDRDELRRVAWRDVGKLERDRIAPAGPFAAALRAGLCGRERPDEAMRHLEEALSGFRRAGMRLYASAVADRLGRLRGGDEGSELRRTAERFMTETQIARPEAMIAMLVPGV